MNLLACNATWWNEAQKKLRHAEVFLDSAMAECFHWQGGYAALDTCGARAVKQLSPLESAASDCQKAAFFTVSLLEGSVLDTIKSVVQASHLEYCILFTLGSHEAHMIARSDQWDDGVGQSLSGSPLFEKLEDKILEWMGNMNFTVEIFYIPLCYTVLMADVALMLPFSKIGPETVHDDFIAEFQRLSTSKKSTIQTFVGCLNSFLASLNLREEVYSVGPFASVVAGRLATLPSAKQRRKSAQVRASLMFVDAMCSISDTVSCSSNHALDQMLFSLPRLDGHCQERAVVLPASRKEAAAKCGGSKYIASGCLFDAENKQLSALYSQAFGCTIKDLQKATMQLLSKFSEKESDALNLSDITGLAQLALGIQQTLDSKDLKVYSRWRLIAQKAGTLCRTSEALSQLTKIVETKKLSIEEEILCLVAMYSGHPNAAIRWDTEVYKASLISRIQTHAFSNISDAAAASDFVESLFSRLRAISKWNGYLRAANNASGSYLENLVRSLLDEASTVDPADVVCKTAGLGDVLMKSGLGMFMNLGKPQRVRDSHVLVFVLLGGVTPSEVERLRTLTSDLVAREQKQVLFLTTQLITARDVIQQFLT